MSWTRLTKTRALRASSAIFALWSPATAELPPREPDRGSGPASGARPYDHSVFLPLGRIEHITPRWILEFLPQQRMERIAIERVPAAKRSLENRPCGGEAQVVPGAGRSLSKFMSHPRAQPQRLCGVLEARKTRRILVGRAPITAKQFVDDLKAAFS